MEVIRRWALPFLLAILSASAVMAQTGAPEADLQTGIGLTREGKFAEAIPHFLAARGNVRDEYAVGFNLALCYVGTRQFAKAIEVLKGLDARGRSTADDDNLLAQAYVGNDQPKEAWDALLRAVAVTPSNEKLYSFVADACMDHHDYELGFKVVDLGLQHVANSARLHYERATFLSFLDEFDRAKPDFEAVSRLAPGSDFAYMAEGEEALLEGNNEQAIRSSRDAISHGVKNYIVLQILGEALIRNGASPGEPEFTEAKTALEKSATLRPDYARSRISLGTLYRLENRLDDAIVQLEQGRELEPSNPAVYTQLAAAYRKKGDPQRTQEMLAILAQLNRKQVEAIGSAPGDHRGYSGRGRTVVTPSQAGRDEEKK